MKSSLLGTVALLALVAGGFARAETRVEPQMGVMVDPEILVADVADNDPGVTPDDGATGDEVATDDGSAVSDESGSGDEGGTDDGSVTEDDGWTSDETPDVYIDEPVDDTGYLPVDVVPVWTLEDGDVLSLQPLDGPMPQVMEGVAMQSGSGGIMPNQRGATVDAHDGGSDCQTKLVPKRGIICE